MQKAAVRHDPLRRLQVVNKEDKRIVLLHCSGTDWSIFHADGIYLYTGTESGN